MHYRGAIIRPSLLSGFAMHYIVTKHAMHRFKQRFKLLFPASYTRDDRMLESLIIGQVSTGKVMTEWKHCPFYVNRVATEYGTGVEVVYKSGVYYVCVVSNGKMFIKTCAPRILFYK